MPLVMTRTRYLTENGQTFSASEWKVPSARPYSREASDTAVAPTPASTPRTTFMLQGWSAFRPLCLVRQ